MDSIRSGNVPGLNYSDAINKIRLVEYENLGGTSVVGNHLDSLPYIMDTFTPGDTPGNRWMDRWQVLAGDGTYILNIPYRFATDYYTRQREHDTMTWMHLLENGINVIGSPEYGGWSGRYTQTGGNRWWKCQSQDTWNGSTNRDNTILRWGNSYKATDIINDFRVRWQWVTNTDYNNANHHPIPAINGDNGLALIRQPVIPGQKVVLDANGSTDPDGDDLTYQWVVYDEISLPGTNLSESTGPTTEVTIPSNNNTTGNPGYVHVYLRVTDNGSIPLTRYKRVIFEVAEVPEPQITFKDQNNNTIESTLELISSLTDDYQITADIAWDQVDSIAFYNNNVLTTIDNSAPYTYTFNRSSEATYEIKARAWFKYQGNSYVTDYSETIIINIVDYRLINHISTKSDKEYLAKVGFGNVQCYTDANYTVYEYPSQLEGAEYIMTPNRDRGSTRGDLLTMNLAGQANVYVAFDRKFSTVPSWINGYYTDTRQHVRTTAGAIMRLYKKRFNAGNVVFGGTGGTKDGTTNYFVIVKYIKSKINIKSPADYTDFHYGTNVTITTNARGSLPIHKVEFFDNNIKIGQSSSAPYSFTINNLGLGKHHLKAKMWYGFPGEIKSTTSPVHTIYGTILLIKSISTKSDKPYQKMQDFGDVKCYTDANYTIYEYPSQLKGAEYIMTPNRDKGSTRGDLLTMNLSQTADVYVAFDRRIETVPSWIRGYYSDTRQHVRTTAGAIMRLYKKRANAGNVVFGGAGASGSNTTNYIVIVKGVGASGSARIASDFVTNEMPDNLTLYPVPTTGTVYINTADPDQPWTILSLQGKTIKSGKGIAIDINDLPDGFYYVKMNNQTYKVVKRR